MRPTLTAHGQTGWQNLDNVKDEKKSNGLSLITDLTPSINNDTNVDGGTSYRGTPLVIGDPIPGYTPRQSISTSQVEGYFSPTQMSAPPIPPPIPPPIATHLPSPSSWPITPNTISPLSNSLAYTGPPPLPGVPTAHLRPPSIPITNLSRDSSSSNLRSSHDGVTITQPSMEKNVMSPTSGSGKSSNFPSVPRPPVNVLFRTLYTDRRPHAVPSNAVVRFADTGNASPLVISSTMVAPPASSSLLSRTGGLPWAVISTPFGMAPYVTDGGLPPSIAYLDMTRCATMATTIALNKSSLAGYGTEDKNRTCSWPKRGTVYGGPRGGPLFFSTSYATELGLQNTGDHGSFGSAHGMGEVWDMSDRERYPAVHNIPRCDRCGCYVNPFATFEEDGRVWRCPLCQSLSAVPSWYYASVDPVTGRRLDENQRPELKFGSVDYILSPEADYSPPPLVDSDEEAQADKALADILRGGKRSGRSDGKDNEEAAAAKAVKMTDAQLNAAIGKTRIKDASLPGNEKMNSNKNWFGGTSTNWFGGSSTATSGVSDSVLGDSTTQTELNLRRRADEIQIYAIDVSPRAVKHGLATAALSAISVSIENLYNELLQVWAMDTVSPPIRPPRIGFVTFSRNVEFYATSSYRAAEIAEEILSGECEGSGARGGNEDLAVNLWQKGLRILVTPAEDPFPPVPAEEWLFPLDAIGMSRVKAVLLRIADVIGRVHRDSERAQKYSSPVVSLPPLEISSLTAYPAPGYPKSPIPLPSQLPPSLPEEKVAFGSNITGDEHNTVPENCCLAAVRAIQQGVSNVGGRLFLFTAFHPTVGFGALSFQRASIDHIISSSFPGGTFRPNTGPTITNSIAPGALQSTSSVGQKVASHSNLWQQPEWESLLYHTPADISSWVIPPYPPMSTATGQESARELLRTRVTEMMTVNSAVERLGNLCCRDGLTVSVFVHVGDLYSLLKDDLGKQFPTADDMNDKTSMNGLFGEFCDLDGLATVCQRTAGGVHLLRTPHVDETAASEMERMLLSLLLPPGTETSSSLRSTSAPGTGINDLVGTSSIDGNDTGRVSVYGRDVLIKLRCSSCYNVSDYIGAGVFTPLEEVAVIPFVDMSTASTFILGVNATAGGSLSGALSAALGGGTNESENSRRGTAGDSGLSGESFLGINKSGGGKSGLSSFFGGGGVAESELVYVQVAVQYTDRRGWRRVRVQTLALAATNKLTTLFEHCDGDAVVATLAKLAAKRHLSSFTAPQSSLSSTARPASAPNSTTSTSSSTSGVLGSSSLLGGRPQSARDWLNSTLVSIFAAYRRDCSPTSTQPGRLVIFESLGSLALYGHGLLKTLSLIENPPLTGGHLLAASSSRTAVSGGNLIPSHLLVHPTDRTRELRWFASAPIRSVVNTVLPRAYSLFSALEHYLRHSEDDKPSEVFCGGDAESFSRWKHERIALLDTLPLTSAVFERGQIYVVDDGSQIWLYISRGVSSDAMTQLFESVVGFPSTVEFRSDTVLGLAATQFLNSLHRDGFTSKSLNAVWSLDARRFCSRLVIDSDGTSDRFSQFVSNLASRVVKAAGR